MSRARPDCPLCAGSSVWRGERCLCLDLDDDGTLPAPPPSPEDWDEEPPTGAETPDAKRGGDGPR